MCLHCLSFNFYDAYDFNLREKKSSAEVRLFYVEQMPLYKKHHHFMKKETQPKTKQLKQNILNHWESMGF